MLDDTARRPQYPQEPQDDIGSSVVNYGFQPGEYGVSHEVGTRGPELVQYLPDAANGDLSQRAIIYQHKGLIINPNSGNIQTQSEDKRSRLCVTTESGNTFMIDGKIVYDLRESKRAGRAVAFQFEEDERLPKIRIGDTWIPTRNDLDDPVVHVEVSLGAPDAIEPDDKFFDVKDEDPFAKFDKDLWAIEERYTEKSKSPLSKLGSKALKGFAAAKAVVKAKSIAGRDRMRKPNMVYGRRQALAVIAVAAVASAATITISESTQDRGNNQIATHKESQPPTRLNSEGRNPWVVSEWILRKFGLNPNPSLEDIDHYDQRMLKQTGIDPSKGEDTRLPDDQVLRPPKILPSETY